MSKSARLKLWNWFVANALFALALLVYVLWPATLIKWLIVAFVWLMLASYLAVLITGSEKPHRRRGPAVLEFALDLAFLAVFIYLGWYLTAAAFIASVIVLDAIIRRDRSRLPASADEA